MQTLFLVNQTLDPNLQLIQSTRGPRQIFSRLPESALFSNRNTVSPDSGAGGKRNGSFFGSRNIKRQRCLSSSTFLAWGRSTVRSWVKLRTLTEPQSHFVVDLLWCLEALSCCISLWQTHTSRLTQGNSLMLSLPNSTHGMMFSCLFFALRLISY